MDKHALALSTYDVLIGRAALRDALVPAADGQFQVLPSNDELTAAEVELLNAPVRERRLRDALDPVREAFDFVLIDCPPSLGELTQAALAASTEVLMPIQCEYFAMEGLTQMIHVIRKVMASQSGRLEFGGILLTMYDPRLELTYEVESEVRDFFGEIVFDTVIPRDVAVSEAPSHGLSVLDYAPRSPGTRAYIELCMEVLDHEQGSAIG